MRFNRHGCFCEKHKWRFEGENMGQVEMLTFCCFCALCKLVFKLHSKNFKRYLYMEEKSIHIQMNIYYIYFTVYLFICLFLWLKLKCYTKKTTLTATTSVSVPYEVPFVCLKWLMISFLKRCSDSLFFLFPFYDFHCIST